MSASEARSKRILVAPLDWGLGHATRCIPIIRELLQLGCEVLIGAENKQAALLRDEFPEIPILPLPGYRIQYAPNAARFGIKMAKQLPQIKRAIHREKKWLNKIIKTHHIDAVISDNRFGLHHPAIPCIIMTHQLLVKSPFGEQTEKWLQKFNYHYIQKFNACWVVDAETGENLAGNLSHPETMPAIPIRYLGCLSRFTHRDDMHQIYDMLVLISGPEPQRSLFEKMILEQTKTTRLRTLIISGQPGKPARRMIADTVWQVNHLNGEALNEAVLQSGLVICRSGYTSVMDMVKLRKKTVFVPTPGQTEQEYLSQYLMEKEYFLSIPQENFNLKNAIQQSGKFPFHFPEKLLTDEYKKVVRQWVNSI